MSRRIKQADLPRILEAHKQWLLDPSTGERADLTGSILTGAYLTGSILTRADLTGSILTGSNLTGSILTGSNLTGSILTRARFTRVNLAGADLTGSILTGSDLTGSILTGAYLTGSILTRADLTGSILTGAYLAGATLPDGVPCVPHIDAAILDAIERGGHLDMSSWHTCSTTHCRAGWAIHLAGEAGYELERMFGSSAAGAMIYARSRPDQAVPDFYCSHNAAAAMDDLRRHAALDPLPEQDVAP